MSYPTTPTTTGCAPHQKFCLDAFFVWFFARVVEGDVLADSYEKVSPKKIKIGHKHAEKEEITNKQVDNHWIGTQNDDDDDDEF